jgi:hypothetical protein
MKGERIPESKLNFTKTVDQLLENIGNGRFFNLTATEKTKNTNSAEVDSDEVE